MLFLDTCPHLQPPVHGAFIPSQARKTRWLPGDTATFRCYPGYSINKNSIYCLQGGRWSSGVPSCTRKQIKTAEIKLDKKISRIFFSSTNNSIAVCTFLSCCILLF